MNNREVTLVKNNEFKKQLSWRPVSAASNFASLAFFNVIFM